MGFRMTDSPFRTTPNSLDTDVDGFPFPSDCRTRAAHFNARLAIQAGGPDRRLWLSATYAVVNGDRLPLSNRAWDFRSNFVRLAKMFSGK